MENIVEDKKVSILENRKVQIIPIKRPSDWMPKEERVFGMMPNTFSSFTLPVSKANNSFVKILDDKEQATFEKKLHKKEGDLNLYNKNTEFWKSFVVRIPDDGLTLDLSDPIDNLRFRICKVMPFISPNWESRDENLKYKFAIVEEEFQEKERVKKAHKISEAWSSYENIKNDKSKLSYVIKIYGIETSNDKKIASNATLDWIQSEVIKIIDNDMSTFMSIVTDPDFEWKSIVSDAISCKALVKTGKTKYALPGGETIATSLSDLMEYLKDPENNPQLMIIKARIKASN